MRLMRREELRELAERAWAVLRRDIALAARNILRQRRRSAIGFIAVTMGVVAMLLAAGFFEWNYDTMREGTIRARIGHIQVVRNGYLDAGVADPFRYLIPEKSEDRSLVEAFPGVESVAPRLYLSGLVSIGESTVSFFGEGVDPVREKKLSGAVRIVSGANLSAADAKEVILGEGLAQSLELEVGRQVVLLVTTASGGVNAVEVRVVGTFATITKAYDDFALRLPLKTAQELMRVQGVHSWLVLLEKTSATERTVDRMRETIKNKDLQLVPWYETPAADFYTKTVSLFSKQVLVVNTMIALIIILSISNTMMANVRERLGEIGTCMALGDTRRTVLRRFLVEGAVMGFFGGVAGTIIGFILAEIISRVGIPMPPPPGMANSFVAGIKVTPGIALNALFLAVLTAFLAGIYPSWKACRMPIADALRHAR